MNTNTILGSVAACLIIVCHIQLVVQASSHSGSTTSILNILNDHGSNNNNDNNVTSGSNNTDNTDRHKRQSFENLANQNVHHHWYCNTSIEWKDLGVLHYPRFVREVTCITGSCMHGFYTCRPQVYDIHVLTVRDEEDEEEITVPHSLRQNWRFTEVAVSVGCLCAA